MLKNWTPTHMPEKEEIKERLQTARNQLYDFQMKIKEHKIPVIVLFEGWGTSGKGSTIGKVIKNIDPRFFKVATMSTPTAEDLRYPFLYRYFKQIPEAGKFTFLDSGWMEQTCRECLEDKIEGEAYTQRIDSIRRFERQLTDNGYLVLKFFMQIDKEDQKERQKALLFHKDTKWRVSNFDKWQNDHYKKCAKIFSQYMSDTNASTAPWYIIDASDRKWAELQILETTTLGSDVMKCTEVEAYLQELVQEIAEDKGFTVHLFECGEGDHVHCFVSAPPKLSITVIVKYLKGISGRKLFERFPEIRNQLWKGELWNHSYYVETVGSVSEENIRRYIEHQSKTY